MPRRHSWLQDYHYELDHGEDRTVGNRNRDDERRPPAPVSPVTVNVNINLGDILDKISRGNATAEEALCEAIELSKRKNLLEG
jgi:hypothetical protein